MSDAVTPIDYAIADPLDAGRAAFTRHAWQEAFELLSRADAGVGLAGPDLESLATAAFFAGHADLRTPTLERAFAAYQHTGEVIRAAFIAMEVASAFSRGARPRSPPPGPDGQSASWTAMPSRTHTASWR